MTFLNYQAVLRTSYVLIRRQMAQSPVIYGILPPLMSYDHENRVKQAASGSGKTTGKGYVEATDDYGSMMRY